MLSTQKHTTPLGNYDVPTGWPMKPYKRPYGGTPGPPVMYEKPSDPKEENAGYGYSNGMSQQERDVFYYHSDHLGSTSYITDKDGNATQFVSYKPYGEALVDEHNTSYEQPWKFNGKELDSETGLYYYGTRYYEPTLALWYGVDALAEKYTNVGGYVYCAGNPMRLVDVDGKAVRPSDDISLLIIKNTLPKEARQFIVLDSNGFIDAQILKQYTGNSGNYQALTTLVESSIHIEVTTLTETIYIFDDKIGVEKFNEVEMWEDLADVDFQRSQANTTGECGNLGVTYMPTNGERGKVVAKNSNSIHININPSLSSIGAAETFSHEGYGHALIYVETGGDRNRAVHHYSGSVDTNIELKEKSIRAKKETVENMRQ